MLNVDKPQKIMLSKRRQTQRLHIVSFYSSELSRIGKSVDIERLVVILAKEVGGKWEMTTGVGFFWEVMKMS
jgi:hypothetical protein